MIKLGKEQQQAIDDILDFLKSEEEMCYSLVGAAGTGKSLTISKLLNRLECSVCLCAPTHKAALVMQSYCNEPALTIHSMLALSPKLDIEKFDISKLQFFTLPSAKEQIPYRGLVICDEASMINDDLFSLLVEKCEDYESKILFVSDKAQLLPVKSRKLSKVYTNCDRTFTLTKIYRQSSENCILPILTELRTKEKFDFVPLQSPDGNLNIYNNIKDFVIACAEDFKIAIQKHNILYTKLLAYTNNLVTTYNKVIQKYIWKDNVLFHKGDILTAYENGTSGVVIDSVDNKNENTIGTPFNYYNGMDYIIEDVKEDAKVIPDVGLVVGYTLQLYDDYNKIIGEVFIVTDKSIYPQLAAKLEEYRLAGIENRKMWGRYFALSKSFSTIDYLYFNDRAVVKKSFDLGYCTTVHRSQGSSYNKIYIDVNSIATCRNKTVRRQLEYVAFSRTRSDVNIYMKYVGRSN